MILKSARNGRIQRLTNSTQVTNLVIANLNKLVSSPSLHFDEKLVQSTRVTSTPLPVSDRTRVKSNEGAKEKTIAEAYANYEHVKMLEEKQKSKKNLTLKNDSQLVKKQIQQIKI